MFFVAGPPLKTPLGKLTATFRRSNSAGFGVRFVAGHASQLLNIAFSLDNKSGGFRNRRLTKCFSGKIVIDDKF